jgi:hypothetical protein
MVTGLFLAVIGAPGRTEGQWIPPGSLGKVPILADCKMTRHGVGVSLQQTLFYPNGAIYLCPERAREIDSEHPGASRFFLVHEYGHLAMHSREEAVADEWAAKQLATVPAERGTLRAVISYFVEKGELFDPLYGTGFDRALRVARAAGIAENEWPLALVIYAKNKQNQAVTGTSVTLRMQAGYTNAAQLILYIDRQPVGFLSNVGGNRPLALARLAPGRHLIQVFQVWLYHIEKSGEKSEVARHLEGECELDSTGAKRIAIEPEFDGDSLSVRAAELR